MHIFGPAPKTSRSVWKLPLTYFMRPRELKKLEYKARCTLLDAERPEFVAVVGLILDLVPLTLEARAANYVRVRLRQPET